MSVYREYKFLLKRMPKQSEQFKLNKNEEIIKQAFVFEQKIIADILSSEMSKVNKSGLQFRSIRLRESIKQGKLKYTVSLVSDDPLIQRFKHEKTISGAEWNEKYKKMFETSPNIQKIRQPFLYKGENIWRVDMFKSINNYEVTNLIIGEISNETAGDRRNAPIELPENIREVLISDVTHEYGYRNEHIAKIGRPLPTINIGIIREEEIEVINNLRTLELDGYSESRNYLTRITCFKNIEQLISSSQDFNYLYLRKDIEPYETPLDIRFDLIIYKIDNESFNKSELLKIREAKLLFKNLKIILWNESGDKNIKKYYSSFDGYITCNEKGFSEAIENILWEFCKIPNQIGVLITHGTDTLPYGLEYLKYAIKEAHFNIIMTGSQIPMGNPYESSDGNNNISSSLLLLNRIKAPAIGVAFDYGRKFFSSNIVKINKWDSNAFYGNPDCTIEFEEISNRSSEFKIIKKNYRLNKIYIFRTGGTIESTESASGYSPKSGADFVTSLITDHLNQYFYEIEDHSVFQEDSSNLTLAHWAFLAKQIEKEVGHCNIDLNLNEKKIKVLYLIPWLVGADYSKYFSDETNGIVLLGYGGGNGNCISKENYKKEIYLKEKDFQDIEKYNLKSHVEQFLNNSKKNHIKIIVLSSQVTLGIIDPIYEVGREFVKIGAIPAANLGVTEILVRLAYLYGHEKYFFKASEKLFLNPGPLEPILQKSEQMGRDVKFDLAEYLFKTAFLCKTRFRTEKSLNEFGKLTAKYYGRPIFILDDNPFIFNKFTKGLEQLLQRMMKVD